MKLRQFLFAAALAALALDTTAATLVVPAAGTGAGANNSQWQSELTLHSTAPRDMTLTLTLHQGTTVSTPATLTLPARQTVSVADAVRTLFNVTSGTGAVVIDAADRDVRALAVTSRTFNASAAGEFGQDIPSYAVTATPAAGDILTLSAPSNASDARFNFGVYAASASVVKWELVRANGIVAATAQATYAQGEHKQYNSGIETLFGAVPANNDTVYARVQSGNVITYGSAINNASGDPSFVPAIRNREDIVIQFLGVDIDEDGNVDFFDADHDGTLDTTLDITTSLFPNYFRVVAIGEFGETVSLELVRSASVVDLLDNRGTVRVTAFGDLKNTIGTIELRGTAAGSSSVFTIPVRYK